MASVRAFLRNLKTAVPTAAASLILVAAVCLFPFAAWADEGEAAVPAGGETPESQDSLQDLNDLGDDNYINLQQAPDSSFLYDISVADLCSADLSYQKKIVQVKGEVVGHALRAEQNPGMYWITLRSEPGEPEGSLSVLVDEKQLQAIDAFGDYNMRGTILRVKGLFHVACTNHEGIIDIHAQEASAVEAGYEMPDDFRFLDYVPGLVLLAVAAGLFIAYRSFAEGER